MNPTKSGVINLRYGVRGDHWQAGYHTGTDFDASTGTPIFATKGGKVIFAGYSGGYGTAYGNHVILESVHKAKRVRHLYAHLSRFGVQAGQTVKVGQQIGLSGGTGNVTGPHLHYEERHAPYGYYDHQPPVLLDYEPLVKPKVSLNKLKHGKSNLHVWRLKRRLNKYFPKKEPLKGRKFNNLLKNRYAEYQRHLGFSGTDANGQPGRDSLERLGFKVVP